MNKLRQLLREPERYACQHALELSSCKLGLFRLLSAGLSITSVISIKGAVLHVSSLGLRLGISELKALRKRTGLLLKYQSTVKDTFPQGLELNYI